MLPWKPIRVGTLALFVAWSVVGQDSNVRCNSRSEWSFNSKKQSPCLVAAYLRSLCDAAPVNVIAVPEGNHYVGPQAVGANRPTECICSTVVYSLMSACGSCQNRLYITWPEWIANCPASMVTVAEFPRGIPDATEVPLWAYQNVTAQPGFTWNSFEARRVAEGEPDESSSLFEPSSTPAPSTTPTSTFVGPPPITPSSVSAGDDRGSKSNTGAIAGGVVGGLVFLIATGLVLFWLFLKNQRKSKLVDTGLHPTPFDVSEANSAARFTSSPPPDTVYSSRSHGVIPTSPKSFDTSFDTHMQMRSTSPSAIHTTFNTRRSLESMASPSQFGAAMVSVRPPARTAYSGAAEIA